MVWETNGFYPVHIVCSAHYILLALYLNQDNFLTTLCEGCILVSLCSQWTLPLVKRVASLLFCVVNVDFFLNMYFLFINFLNKKEMWLFSLALRENWFSWLALFRFRECLFGWQLVGYRENKCGSLSICNSLHCLKKRKGKTDSRPRTIVCGRTSAPNLNSQLHRLNSGCICLQNSCTLEPCLTMWRVFPGCHNYSSMA